MTVALGRSKRCVMLEQLATLFCVDDVAGTDGAVRMTYEVVGRRWGH
jgi:hypothetical protein